MIYITYIIRIKYSDQENQAVVKKLIEEARGQDVHYLYFMLKAWNQPRYLPPGNSHVKKGHAHSMT